MDRFAVRLWVPDVPGVLGAVATRIGEAGGNVTALEVLERQGGVAVDELVVELDDPALLDRIATGVRQIDGAGIEEIRKLPAEQEERGLLVMAAAVAILEAPAAPVALDTLLDAAGDLFDLTWSALADVSAGEYVHRVGDAPSVEWFRAFASGTRVRDGVDTAGSGVLAAELLNAGLTLGVGRGVPFRRRERREVELLVRVTDRVWAALERSR